MSRAAVIAALLLTAASSLAQDVATIDAGNLAAYRAYLAATGAQTIVVRGSTPEATARLTAVLALGTTMQPQTRAFTHATAAATTAGSPAPPNAFCCCYSSQSVLPKITVPWGSVSQNGSRSSFVVDIDSLHSDLDTAARWADGANAACACPVQSGAVMVGGYEWLRGNPAAVADWRAHSGGQDPVLWLCEQGYDSPLATFWASFNFNRPIEDISLSVATVQYNGVDYPGVLIPNDCLAGCAVSARVPCASERQSTLIKLAAPGAAPAKCIWLFGGGGVERQCPSGVQP